jgi:hypothetical protein
MHSKERADGTNGICCFGCRDLDVVSCELEAEPPPPARLTVHRQFKLVCPVHRGVFSLFHLHPIR